MGLDEPDPLRKPLKTEIMNRQNGEGVRPYRRRKSSIRPIWRLLGITRKIPTALPTTQPHENYWHIKSFRSAIQGVKNDFASFDFRMPHRRLRPLPCQSEQMAWGPERPVKCLQVSQEVTRSPRSTPSANTQRDEQEQA